jgi:hypothetical protein
MKIYLYLLTVIFLFNACEKSPCSENYIPGEILMTFEDSATLIETFELIDSFNLSILLLSNFDYYLNNNNTPVDTIINTLESKNYLLQVSHTQNSASQTEIQLIFNNFDIISKSDWIATVLQYQLLENLTDITFMKFGTIKVPESEEDYWVDIFKQHKIIRSVSRNPYMCI